MLHTPEAQAQEEPRGDKAVTDAVAEAGGDPASACRPALGPPRAFNAFLRRLLSLFFRRIEVVGLEHVPARGGGVLIAWHPNGLLDPALVLNHFPRRVVFGARHGLLRWPVLGRVMRYLGTVPIYRPQDAGPHLDEAARREGNRKSLEILAQAVADGSFAAIFPEGVSHDDSLLHELKPGAARLYLAAHELTPEGEPAPVVIPVGLHYDRKNFFRSGALVEIYPPIDLPPELVRPAADEEERRGQVAGLTGIFFRVLTEVVQATESWELHHRMHQLRKIFRAERAVRATARPGPATLHERILGLARVRLGYMVRLHSHPVETKRLEDRVRRYGRALDALGLDDHELDEQADLGSPWPLVWLVAQAVAVYLVLPPLLVFGYVVNAPVALVLSALARRFGAKVKDEASLKLLLGVVAFPLVWLGVSLLVVWETVRLGAFYPQIPDNPWLAGVVTFLLCSVGGWVALRYLHVPLEIYRALKIRLARARRQGAVRHLLEERAAIFEAALALSEGLDLPGSVAPDGRIVAGAPGSGSGGPAAG